jgi:hypothetical protein
MPACMRAPLTSHENRIAPQNSNSISTLSEFDHVDWCRLKAKKGVTPLKTLLAESQKYKEQKHKQKQVVHCMHILSNTCDRTHDDRHFNAATSAMSFFVFT